ncbi:MAG: hypothetical protein LBE89_06610 [Helicobacteraceae bacterium]|nr:hypothetical protein [Helicobacteraceae bacterium]
MEINTQIILGGNNPNYLSPMCINEIIVETDFFEGLSIDLSENYTREQLEIVDYDIKNGVYVLRNYNLETIIPIDIVDKNTGKSISKNIFIEMDNKNGEMKNKLKFIDKEIVYKNYDLLNAFERLYTEINHDYLIRICAFCKKSCWNPYGGSDFCNHLCFKEFSEEYNKIETKDKLTIAEILNKNIDKYRNVYLTYSCNEYMEK